MNDRLTAWFPLLLLAVLAVLTLWLDRVVQPTAGIRDGSTRHDPDYIVDTISAIQMDEDGRIKHTLAADKMIHYPDDDSTRLQSPKFVNYATTTAPITITAREALLSKNGEDVYFRDNVRVNRGPYDSRSELVMETDYLHVIPDKNIAKTDRPVTITDDNTVVHAVGLELDSEARILKLNARVKGTYDQKKK